jgi:hypothetical protein
MREKHDFIMHGVVWRHSPETAHEWEEWMLRLTNHKLLCVRRIDANTKLCPTDFNRDEWTSAYEVKLDWEPVTTIPLDTPIEDALVRAIAEARMK